MYRLIFLFSAILFASPLYAIGNQWVEVSSEHFAVVTDSSQKEATQLLDEFERMRWVFGTLFAKTSSDNTQQIVVVAVKNYKTFQLMEPSAYLAKGQLKLAGLFLNGPDKNYILLNLDTESEHPYAIIYHEYTHYYMRRSMAWLPLWVNEGMAEFFENTEIRNKDVEVGKPSVENILYLREHTLIPLPELFKVDAKSPYYHDEQKGSVFYAESWALIHYLQINDRMKGTHHLAEYLTSMSQREDPVVAAAKAFGDLKALEQNLGYYIRAQMYKQLQLNSAAAKIDESTFKVRIINPLDADALRANVLIYVRRNEEARVLAESVLKSDAKNARALEALGSLAFQQGRTPDALEYFRKARGLDPHSAIAQYYFATLSMMAGSYEDETEASLQEAIHMEPGYAQAYDRLAAYYAMKNTRPVEAWQAEYKAIQLDPGNINYRLNASSLLLHQLKFSDAEAVLQAALSIARTANDESLVREQIDAIAQAKRSHEESLAVLNQPAIPASGTGLVTLIDEVPTRPPAEIDAPRHSAEGEIHDVICSYPAIIQFKLIGAKRSYVLFNNNMDKIDLSVSGIEVTNSMNPCHDFEGKKAQVKYAESSDKSVDGQVNVVVLKK